MPYEHQRSKFNTVLDDSDSDDSEYGPPELEERSLAIMTTMRNLYRLSFLIRRPGAKVASQRAMVYKETIPDSGGVEYGEAFQTSDRWHVANLLNDLRKVVFADTVKDGVNAALDEAEGAIADTSKNDVSPPLVAIEDPLVDLLATAITKRRRQFRYRLRHRDKLSEIPTQENNEMKRMAPSERRGSHLNKRQVMVGTDTPIVLATSQGPRTETEATRYIPLSYVPEDVVSLAPSASTARDLRGEEATSPKPPETSGEEFECPYCFVLCPPKEATRSRWR